MAATLRHRGPDGDGILIEGPVGLAHRRLSIIDLEGGAQPMESAGARSVITYNGAIYNYRALRERLADGYAFRTRSDTEVILALYEARGEAGLEELRGMFAFALWDRERRRLLLARDRIGIKPLYWADRGGRLYFASEIKALRAVLPAGELNPESVNAYFSRQYVGGPSTIFRDIHKVLPGRFLRAGDSGIEEGTYWEPRPERGASIGWTEAVERTDAALEDAARSHLVSDVPVGLFLSGGLDSSCLLAYASSVADTALHTFSVGFGDGSPLTETPAARAVARHFGTSHHEIEVGPSEMLRALPRILQAMDEPCADYAMVPTYVMSEFASEHVKVVLSGEGADELFGGYGRYRTYAALDAVGRFLPARWLPGGRLPAPAVFSDDDRRRLLGERFLERSALPAERALAREKLAALGAGHLNSMLVTDLRGWLVDDLLMKVDKMGMLASIEGRVPYLDHRLVELLLSLPGRFKAGVIRRKRLLRELARGRVPEATRRRPKQGFTVPVGRWLTGPLRGSFREAVLEGTGHGGWVDRGFAEALLRRQETRGDRRLQLWSIYVFCRWAELHLGG